MANARALSVAVVHGGVGLQRQAKLAARAHIVVATPGRLEDLLQRGDITLEHVQVLVLDEADRMLDMGFKPAVDRIVAKVPADRQTLFFSATLEGEVGRQAKAYTHDPKRHVHAPEPERKADVRASLRAPRPRRQARRPGAASCATTTAGARWCSCAPSAAPTGWSSASRHKT